MENLKLSSIYLSEWGQRLSVLLTMLTGAMLVTINFTPLYGLFLWGQNLGILVGESNAALWDDYHHLLAYLEYPWVRSLEMNLPSSYAALQHYQDVKGWFLVTWIVFIISLPVTVRYLRKLKQQKRIWTLQRFIQITITILMGLFVLMGLNFNRFFITFHQLFFPGKTNWLFDPQNDPMILALPELFFATAFGLCLLLLAGQMYLLYFLGKRELR